jgi:hypothetical protein
MAFILALAKLTTVNLAPLANALNGTAKTAAQLSTDPTSLSTI